MSTIQRTDQDIQREIEDVIARVGVPLEVTVENGVVKLEGVVLSEEEREAVVDLLRLIPGVRDVEDSLIVVEELEGEEPDVLYGMLTHPEDPDLLPGEVVEDEDSGIPDKITTYDPGRVEDDWTTDERVAVQEAMPYFPPTDPAVDIADDRPENIQVTTGFQATAMDDDAEYEDETVDDDGIVRDAALVDAVVRELNEDSSTTHLNIHVASVRGVVVLTGFVSSQTDADLAEAVADRVPGVRFVADRLIVSDCPP